jgi:hypothetical protein
LPAEKLRGLHQEKIAAFRAAEPIENLQELELVIEVMLEPQHHAVEGVGASKPAIARLEIGGDLLAVSPPAIGEILGTDCGQLGKRRGERDRVLMQHVAPG